MLQIILGILFICIIPVALIHFFVKLDNEYAEQLKLERKHLIIIGIITLVYIILTFNLKELTNMNYYINNTLLMGYLVFMSYTDQKIKQVYSILSIAMILIEIMFIIINRNTVPFNETTIYLIFPIIIFGIMSIFRLIGFGDVLIYLVIELFTMQYNIIPIGNMIIIILVANTLFLITSLIIKLVKHDKNNKQPLTMYIAISTFLCNILLI